MKMMVSRPWKGYIYKYIYIYIHIYIYMDHMWPCAQNFASHKYIGCSRSIPGNMASFGSALLRELKIITVWAVYFQAS